MPRHRNVVGSIPSKEFLLPKMIFREIPRSPQCKEQGWNEGTSPPRITRNRRDIEGEGDFSCLENEKLLTLNYVYIYMCVCMYRKEDDGKSKKVYIAFKYKFRNIYTKCKYQW